MKQNIYIFKDLEDAIYKLEKFGNKFEFPRNFDSKEKIIIRCVSSNTFRGFRKSYKKPSELFRSWAEINFDQLIVSLKSIRNREEFDKLISEKTKSFIDYWEESVLEPSQLIIYGPAIKMINLLLKHIQESEYFRNDNLIKHLHVPFDSFSLKPMMNIINELTTVNYRISIPTNVTMKYVNCPEIYWILLDSIRVLSKKAKISSIVYDYWSWNEKHLSKSYHER